MADRPIIFSGPMVRALLDGRKTQARRVIKPQPVHDAAFVTMSNYGRWIAKDSLGYAYLVNVPHAPGDRLWVKEAWRAGRGYDGASIRDMARFSRIWFEADDANDNADAIGRRLRPSIHMPRWASRLTLTVTDVRVQRLQDITAEDCAAEGIPFEEDALAPYEWSVLRFSDLWNSLHGPDAWDANPWVVALTFTVERRNIDAAKEAEE